MYKLKNTLIKGIVTCVPNNEIKNKDFFKNRVSEYEDFINRVGIKKRKVSNGKLTTSDLCLAATKELIKNIEWEIKDIDILIFVSQSHDYNIPPTSYYIQNELGLKKETFLLDLNLGCTGWVNGLASLIPIMKSYKFKKGLLLCGETNILTDKNEQSTYLLMGDAGTSTAVEITDAIKSEIDFQFQNYGNLYDSIISPNSKAKYIQQFKDSLTRKVSLTTKMDGGKLLLFTLKNVIPSIKYFLHNHQSNVENIDFFILHQANKMFNKNIVKKLNIKESKVPYSLEDYGNTSSASIPLTICYLGYHKSVSNKTLMCSSFGVGLSIANLHFKTPQSFFTKIIHI